MVAHRLSIVQHADKIIVMKDGGIETQGTHSQLLGINPTYTQLWHHHIRASGWKIR